MVRASIAAYSSVLVIATLACRGGSELPPSRGGIAGMDGSGGMPDAAASGSGGNGAGNPSMNDAGAAGAGSLGPGSTGGAGGSIGGTGGTIVVVNEPACVWPTPSGTRALGSATMRISGTFDGGMQRFTGEGSTQSEGNPAVFQLDSGATLENVIIGAPAGDGVHCRGSCTLRNVWWEDVGEDAATLEGSAPDQMMIVEGGGARAAADKVIQHNGPGTVVIRRFCVQDFGKLYRSCGNCDTQYLRHVVIEDVSATPRATSEALVGVNQNFGDTATLHNVIVHGGVAASLPICLRYQGNDTGAEPTPLGAGADGVVCLYDPTRDVFVLP